MKLTKEDLLEVGWTEDDPIDALLEEAARLEAKGNERSYVLKRLDRVHARFQPSLGMRAEPVPFAEAVDAETKEELKNLKAARRTMRELMACPVVEAGALMPDTCPSSSAIASIPVGGAIAVRNAIIPAAHGSDICCSMQATIYEAPESRSVSGLMDDLMGVTRFGPGGRRPEDQLSHPVTSEAVWENPFLRGFQNDARSHLADQGDGNHFAFLGEIETDETWLGRVREAGHRETFAQLEAGRCYQVLITHHGSRRLGARVYQRGQEEAILQTKRIAKGVPEAAAWLAMDSPKGQAYWEALQYLSRWTYANHRLIHDHYLEAIGASPLAVFGNEHNFVWKRGEQFLHGKGATPAWRDAQDRPLLGLIPLNMASPVLLVLGNDCEDYLSFAPHGAGRNRSRRAVMREFRARDGSLDEEAIARALAKATEGIEVRWFQGKADLSESPLGYKPADKVREQIERYELAEIVTEIAPLGSIMAGRSKGREEELTPKQRRQMEHRSDRRKLKQRMRDGDWEEGA